MSVKSMYVFGGQKFEEYVDLKNFKKSLEETLNYSPTSEKVADKFSKIYLDVIKNKPKVEVDKLLFDHIFYGKLKHVYLQKLQNQNEMTISKFESNVNMLFENYKSKAIADDLLRSMKPEGFLFLDSLNITKSNVYFIAGLKRTVLNGKVHKIQLLVGKTYPYTEQNGRNKIRYLLAGIDIDYKEGHCLILINNASDVSKDEKDDAKVSSPASFHQYINQKILPFFNLNTIIKAKEDKKGMFTFCKEMLDTMFADSRKEIKQQFENDINSFTEKSIMKLNSIGNKTQPKQNRDLSSTIETLLLGIYIKNNLSDGNELKKMAKKLGLLGYPTKIHYKNSSSNKSSTGSSSAQKPIHESETLYNLYTDFGNSKRLEEWSMAWFTDKTNMDVIRTTITSTQKYFKIVFAPTRQLDEGIIYHVVQNLNKKRCY